MVDFIGVVVFVKCLRMESVYLAISSLTAPKSPAPLTIGFFRSYYELNEAQIRGSINRVVVKPGR